MTRVRLVIVWGSQHWQMPTPSRPRGLEPPELAQSLVLVMSVFCRMARGICRRVNGMCFHVVQQALTTHTIYHQILEHGLYFSLRHSKLLSAARYGII